MDELEHEIEVAAAAEEPEQAEDELAGEPEEENTGKHRLPSLYVHHWHTFQIAEVLSLPSSSLVVSEMPIDI